MKDWFMSHGAKPNLYRGVVMKERLDNWFMYHRAKPKQNAAYEEIRAAAKVLAETIVRLTPSSADQDAAIRKVREAVFTANAAIACGGV